MELLEHLLLLDRQVGHNAMQKERRLVEQPLGRFDPLDHHASRQRVQACVLLGRQLLAGEDDHGQVAQRDVVANMLEHLEARHVGQPEVEDRAIIGCVTKRGERFRARADDGDLDVVVTEELGDAELLGVVVLHHQEPPCTAGSDVLRRS